MDSFFLFFFIIIKQRNSYWISRIYFFLYSMNKIFPNTVQTRLVDFYRFSSSTTWENNKIHSWSPFGQTRAYHAAVSRTSILVFRIIETCCWRIFTFQCQSSSRQRRGSSWTARYSTSGWTPLSTGALPPNCKITFKNR